MKNTHTKAWERLFFIAVGVLMFLAVCAVSPLNDDWYYATAPNPDFQWADLLPASNFWRPLDVLFGAFMGLVPALFPALNRAVVVLAHVLNAWLLNAVLKKVNITDGWRRLAVGYFLFSSAVVAVIVSPDALNQAYSLLFGLLAVYIHLKRGGYWYLPLCMIALLWKESGVSWFFVIPILEAITKADTWRAFRKNVVLVKRCVYETVFSFLSVGVYFAARFLLYGSVTLGSDTGTYQLSVFSLSTVKNAVMLFASAASGVDSPAVFGNTPALLPAGITAVLSLVFAGGWLIGAVRLIRQKQGLFPLCGLVLCALGLALPLTVIGSAGEMHAYPVLCAMAVLIAFCMSRAQISPKRMAVPILCIFLAFGISGTHKLMYVYDYSARTRELTQNIRAVYGAPSDAALFVVVEDWEGYSVFDQSAVNGCYAGLSLRPYFDWQELNHTRYEARSEEEAAAYIAQHGDAFDSVYVVREQAVERVK
ncbi:MAG: hypothetical protein E7552_07050 [Ruminococcaceae bacterium]|nr:hypothetical protein [Oscillospiraceae bacterium]